MSEVTKLTMPTAVGQPYDQSAVTKLVMYVAVDGPAVARRRIVHGRISYNKRMT